MRDAKTPGSFAWFDLVTEAPDVARTYYSELFGWTIRPPASDNTSVISSNGEFIGGLVFVEGKDDKPESRWQPVLSVDDTLNAIQTVKSSGGQLAEQPIQNQAGVFAVVRDNSGAALTLFDGSAGLPLDETAKNNTWIWADLITSNTSGAKRFYKSVAGFETRQDQSSGQAYTIFTRNGEDRGGLVWASKSQIEPNWLPFILVADLNATIEKSNALGGRLLARDGGTAILIDPTGAAVGVTTREGISE
ncbi:VOC family protein [Falsiphaeobacter marinintestinus]|uniref:VOC family protein n=1 Tax=Falsiphaeobacter marinintestinus TaxID=1492905 RepID=UPI0011B849D6|nr:VOC family protein [Phaeobacter marinintestinus]